MRRIKRSGWWVVVLSAAVAWIVAVAAQPPRAAEAQVPDAGAQRAEMIRELKAANEKLAAIAGLLSDIRDQGDPKKDKEKPGRP